MNPRPPAPDSLPAGYAGRILNGDFSTELKTRLAECIARFARFDESGGPAIPYIAAWRETDGILWYEYAGRDFTDLMDCGFEDLADRFRLRIRERRIYKQPANAPGDYKEDLEADDLKKARPQLRKDAAEQGVLDAVYQLDLGEERVVWIKDLARVERYRQDRICVSLGNLTPLTKEMEAEEKCARLIEQLRAALSKVKTLSGLLPICASCKKIRDDKGYWNRIEEYITQHSEAIFSHSVCPECARKLYPELYEKDQERDPLVDDIAAIDVFLKNT